jgi:hypothetical protein
MATDGRSKGIIDTSVLLNFLKIDRTDLLALHPDYRFVVLDLIRNEVGTKPYYAAQATRLEAAIAAGHLLADDPAEATDIAELAAFAAMSTLKIGDGERAAVAAAFARGLPLAMEDHRAWNRTATYSAGVPTENTESIIVSLINAGVLTVAEADAIKHDWQANHKFTLTFTSFAEKV